MSVGRMKNMIVLKDLPSNIIDEAIVILKPNIKIKNLNMIDAQKNNKRGEESKKDPKNYIINEAQMVISNYIGTLEIQKEKKQDKTKKEKSNHKTLKTAAIILGILLLVNIILIGIL